jgi:hypothetical protein
LKEGKLTLLLCVKRCLQREVAMSGKFTQKLFRLANPSSEMIKDVHGNNPSSFSEGIESWVDTADWW